MQGRKKTQNAIVHNRPYPSIIATLTTRIAAHRQQSESHTLCWASRFTSATQPPTYCFLAASREWGAPVVSNYKPPLAAPGCLQLQLLGSQAGGLVLGKGPEPHQQDALNYALPAAVFILTLILLRHSSNVSVQWRLSVAMINNSIYIDAGVAEWHISARFEAALWTSLKDPALEETHATLLRGQIHTVGHTPAKNGGLEELWGTTWRLQNAQRHRPR